MNPSRLFTEDDRRRLAEAVQAAERATSGEIVPYVVGRSDDYPEAIWRAGALGGFLALFAFVVVDLGTSHWLPFSISEVALYSIGAFLIGAGLVAAIPRLRLLVVSSGTVRERVEERASLAFLSEQVFATRERTGILIMISLLEHRVRVLADDGIAARVRQEEWDGMVAVIVDGMKRGQVAEALIAALQRCGTLLGERGVEIRDDDTNELDNSIRMSDR